MKKWSLWENRRRNSEKKKTKIITKDKGVEEEEENRLLRRGEKPNTKCDKYTYVFALTFPSTIFVYPTYKKGV